MATVVLIEDDQPLRATMARILRAAQHQVLEAGNGMDGLALIAEHAPDLVVTDINMPEMDGIEVVNRIRDLEVHVPVLAVSGGGRLAKSALLNDAHLLGAVGTLEKPFGPEELTDAVTRALHPQPEPNDAD